MADKRRAVRGRGAGEIIACGETGETGRDPTQPRSCAARTNWAPLGGSEGIKTAVISNVYYLYPDAAGIYKTSFNTVRSNKQETPPTLHGTSHVFIHTSSPSQETQRFAQSGWNSCTIFCLFPKRKDVISTETLSVAVLTFQVCWSIPDGTFECDSLELKQSAKRCACVNL